jgi:hypothetical protein
MGQTWAVIASVPAAALGDNERLAGIRQYRYERYDVRVLLWANDGS